MKIKWLIPIILILATIQIVFAGWECDLSTDNSTWENITRYGGSTNEEFREAYIPLLDENTHYYFRCRNDTSFWAYTEQETEEGGINEMIIAVSLIFIFFTCIVLIGLAKAERNWVRMLWGLGLSIMIMTLTRLSIWFVDISEPTETGLIDTLSQYYGWSIWIFRVMLWISVGMLLLIVLNVMNYKKWKKRDSDYLEDIDE